MGEIAESLINGEFDYITGEYLGCLLYTSPSPRDTR